MATMKRLLKLEIWKLAQYRTNLLVLLGLLIFCSVTARSAAFGLVLTVYMLVYTPLAYDEQSKGEYLLCALPVSRKQVVQAKYIMIAAELAALSLLMLGANRIFVWAFFDWKDTQNLLGMQQLGMLLMMGAIFAGVLLPLVLRFGVLRARIWVIILYAVSVAVANGTLGIFSPAAWTGTDTPLTIGWKFIGVAVVLLISYLAALTVYNRREFTE